MTRPTPLALALTVLLSGCYSTVDSYVPALAKQHCKRLEECNQTLFDEAYGGDLRECRDQREDDLYMAADDLEMTSWEYDKHAGRDCIKAYRDRKGDCSVGADLEIADLCFDVVWDGF